MSYFITTDATCDFPKQLSFENFKIIPMSYIIDDIEYGIDKELLPILLLNFLDLF